MPQEVELIEGFWGHVAEFLKRLKIVLATFLVVLVVMLVLPGNTDFFAVTSNYKPLMSVVLGYVNNIFLPEEARLMATSMSDPITLYVYAGLVFAVGITLPVFAYEAYKFVDPALYPHERKALFPFLGSTSALFAVGALFGFFFLAPAFIGGFFPFYRALNVEELIPVMDFYSVVFLTVIVSGLLFTIPAFFVMLVKFGVLHTKSISKQRKYIYAGLGIAAMFISPGATPLGDLYLFIALVLLIEASLFLGKHFENKTGTQESQTVLSQFFTAPSTTCKFCKTPITPTAFYCQNCKRYLK